MSKSNHALGLASCLFLAASLTLAPAASGQYEEFQITASDASLRDKFGTSVSISVDTVVVGTDGAAAGTLPDAGAAYVFVQTGTTTWTQQAKLTADDATVGDVLGRSVSISGDTVIAGAVGDDLDGVELTGAAYVFFRTGTSWSQQAKFIPEEGDAVQFDNFGHAVSISGDTAIVSALGDDTIVSANVYVRTETKTGPTWDLQQKLFADDGVAGDHFGRSVAISGDIAIVGAHASESVAGTVVGAAYVFVRKGTSWTQEAKLTASDAAQFDTFGYSASIFGTTAVVGAPGRNDGASNTGAAYVFVRTGTSWTQQAKLTADDAAADDSFGFAVSVSGETAVIGAKGDDSDRGSAYVFGRAGLIWAQQERLTADDGEANDLYGFSVAVSDGTPIVGAQKDTGAALQTGSAYIYSCPADLDGAGGVGFPDLVIILSEWGCVGCPSDLDGNGSTGFTDLVIVLNQWDCGN